MRLSKTVLRFLSALDKSSVVAITLSSVKVGIVKVCVPSVKIGVVRVLIPVNASASSRVASVVADDDAGAVIRPLPDALRKLAITGVVRVLFVRVCWASNVAKVSVEVNWGTEINLPSSDPIIRNQGNRSVAPGLPEYVTDIMAVDRRVEALIDYLEHWIRVGNLKMTDIRDYIQNYTA